MKPQNLCLVVLLTFSVLPGYGKTSFFHFTFSETLNRKSIMDNNGKLLPMNCKVGDRVLLPEYGGTPLKMGEEEYTLFCDCDILGKFE